MADVAQKKKQDAPAEEKPENKNFIVVAAATAIPISAASERDAVRQVVSQEGTSGRYLVCEADYMETFIASQRIELKPENISALFEKA